MESLSLAKEKIIKVIRNLFRLKKEQIYTGIKDIRNLLRLEKVIKVIKDRIFRAIKNLFEYEEEEENYKTTRVSNFWSNDYVEYESNSDRNKEYLHKIRSYLKGIS